jgi:hypothetical protein
MKMCLRSKMESTMCKKTSEPDSTSAVQVLKGVRDACSHCREFQCSPGLCYAGPCPQGKVDESVNPDCLSSDYCWNPAPVSVKGTRFKLCFAKVTEGGHGLTISNGRVIVDNKSFSPNASQNSVSLAHNNMKVRNEFSSDSDASSDSDTSLQSIRQHHNGRNTMRNTQQIQGGSYDDYNAHSVAQMMHFQQEQQRQQAAAAQYQAQQQQFAYPNQFYNNAQPLAYGAPQYGYQQPSNMYQQAPMFQQPSFGQ